MKPQGFGFAFVLFLGSFVFQAVTQRFAIAGETPNSQPTHAIDLLLESFCMSCHSGDAPDADLSFNRIDPRIAKGRDFESWRLVYDRVKWGEMPPDGPRQPTAVQRRKLLAMLRGQLLKTQAPGQQFQEKLHQPQFGNYVDHDKLFEEDAGPVTPGPPRLWRLRPLIFRNFMDGESLERKTRSNENSSPFSTARGADFSDYARAYIVDEPTTLQLLTKVETLVRSRSQSEIDLLAALEPSSDTETIKRIIGRTFQSILQRDPTEDESARYEKFFFDVARTSGNRIAAEQVLIAIYMRPEVLFREELGSGTPDSFGRVRLSQREIAFAISYALGNSPDSELLAASRRGRLATRPDIITHLKRRLEGRLDLAANPRLLHFFREYFGYANAIEVFKNPSTRGLHLPRMLIGDLDLTISHVMDVDESVLANLLTTNQFFVDSRRNPDTAKLVQFSKDLQMEAGPLEGRNPEVATVYGLPRDWFWTDQQPVTIPGRQRAGVLTHPAWLVAWSGNFDNHPVQRGKWIRTHLLGGTVPDVPIGVDAVVPEDHHKSFRERLSIATSSDACQRCHRKMDPLGLPFEQYDHYGRFRRQEVGRQVDTTGAMTLVDEDALLGAVSDPIEMLERLARSERVEQVFVRYAFRFFMGRNESLGDARTLQEAHESYQSSGGSFRSLVISLLTSDSFLYRFVGVPDA